MRLKVYTDASHNPRTRVGAYGIVIEAEDGRVWRSSGPMAGRVECPTQAEVRAAVIGIGLALKKGDVEWLDVYMDSKSAMRMLTKESWFWTRDKYRHTVEVYAEMTEEVVVKFHYVRSHQGSATHDTKRNEECDRASKEARRAEEGRRGLHSRRDEVPDPARS